MTVGGSCYDLPGHSIALGGEVLTCREMADHITASFLCSLYGATGGACCATCEQKRNPGWSLCS